MVNLNNIANSFQLEGNIKTIEPLGGGFINSTYLVKTEGDSPDYILQRKNRNIFKDIPGMMDNIVRVSSHIADKVTAEGGNPQREAMTIVNATDGNPYFVDDEGEYWTVSVFIPDTITYEKADTPQLAFKGGEGIGKFQMQLADFEQSLNPTIPGFHDLRFRFSQWDEALRNNKAGRLNKVAAEIDWIEQRRSEMLDFWKLVENGTLPKRVTHNDTKLSNILFDKEGNVLCVIDLDTVMSNTVLADYGDAIRSFANTGLEDDPNLANVGVNPEIYRAYTDGFLSLTGNVLTEAELEYLSFGPRYITFEQVLRFLMDYIDGDTYYRIEYPEHNLVRTHAQQKLLESLERFKG